MRTADILQIENSRYRKVRLDLRLTSTGEILYCCHLLLDAKKQMQLWDIKVQYMQLTK